MSKVPIYGRFVESDDVEEVAKAYGFLFHIPNPDEKVKEARDSLEQVLSENEQACGIAAARALGATVASWDMENAGC